MSVEETSRGGPEETPRRPAEQLSLLLTRARSGEEAAFRSLYRTLTPELLRYAAVLVGQDAEDVVAEAWLQASRDLFRFEGDGPAFRRFVLAVTRNRAHDLLRRRKRRVAEYTVPHADLPEPRLGHGQAGRDAAEIVGSRLSEREALARIARLPRTQAEAVLLRVVLDMDNRSAAEVLKRRPGTVAMALSRGLRRLARTAREEHVAAQEARNGNRNASETTVREVRTRCTTGPTTTRSCDG